MLGTIGRICLLVGVAVILAILGTAAVEAKGPKTGEVPLVDPGVFDCIDFDSGSMCGIAVPAESGLIDEQFGINTCRDGLDNDSDERADRRDSDCHITCHTYAAGRVCSDRDHDGWLEYVELAYGSDPNDASSTPETPVLPATCDDGLDNDGDGLTDADEPGCSVADCIDFSDDPDCPAL